MSELVVMAVLAISGTLLVYCALAVVLDEALRVIRGCSDWED